MDWAEFIAAGLVFLASHRVPTIPVVRARLAGALGERGFLIGYSLVSLGLLSWLILAAGRAPYVELWRPAPWQAWVPSLAMPVVCLLAAFAIGAPNPLSFGGGPAARFDPDRPGIAGVARHALLWALAIWSATHIVPNGDLAHVILFGAFAVFSLYGMRIIDRRKQRQLGMARWNDLARATSSWPLQALLDGRWRPDLGRMGRGAGLRLAIAVAVYLGLLWSHEAVIGVSPWPAP